MRAARNLCVVRKMRRDFKSRERGVSMVLATFLLIAITVAASLLVYVWHTGLVGRLQGKGGEEIKSQLIMEDYEDKSNSSWALHLRDTGRRAITVSSVYLNGASNLFSGVTTHQPGDSGTLAVDVSGPSPGQAQGIWLGLLPLTGRTLPSDSLWTAGIGEWYVSALGTRFSTLFLYNLRRMYLAHRPFFGQAFC